MSGIVIRILPKTLYVYQPPTAETGVPTTQIILARRIDASRYQNGVLVFRLHSASNFTAGTTLTLSYFADGYTDEDPGITNWTAGNGQFTPNNLLMTGGTDGAQTVRFGALTSPFPPLIGIGLLISSNTLGATAVKVEVSCDLNLKGE